MTRAVFLDRDGVLVEDTGALVHPSDVRVLPHVVEALISLRSRGWQLVVVSNQTVVARGLASEAEVIALQRSIEATLVAAGAPAFDDFLFCPHHPHATDPAYRVACDCRKPRPGLIDRACARHGIDPRKSVIGPPVGDFNMEDLVEDEQDDGSAIPPQPGTSPQSTERRDSRRRRPGTAAR